MPLDPQPPPDEQAFRFWRRNMRLLSAGNLGVNMGFSATIPFLPLMVTEMGGAAHLETWVGAMVFGYFLVSFLLTPLWGAVADHFGRRSMLLRAGLGMGIGFLLLPLIGDPLGFLLALMLIGAANGFVPAGMALVATNTPQQYLGAALAGVQVGALVGSSVGPLVGSLVTPLLPRYRDLYFVCGASTLVGGLLVLLFVREVLPAPAGPFRPNLTGDLRLLLRTPQFRALYLLNFVFAVNFFGSNSVMALMTLQLAGERPLPLGQPIEVWLGVVGLSMTVSSVVALPLWGRVLDRFNPVRVMLLILAAAGALSLLFPLVRDPLELTVARFVFGAVLAGLAPALVSAIKRRAPKGMDARALSYGAAMQNLGNGGAGLAAGVVAPLVGLRAYFLLASALLLLGLYVWARSTRSEPEFHKRLRWLRGATPAPGPASADGPKKG